MDANVRFGWQVLYRAKRSLIGRPNANHLILTREVTAWPKRISARNATLYHPLELVATNRFHDSARAELKASFSIDVKEKNFPYVMPLDGFSSPVRIGLIGHLFLPDLISIRVTIYNYQRLDEDKAFQQRAFAAHEPLRHLVKLFASSALEGRSNSGEKLEQVQVIPIVLLISNDMHPKFVEDNAAYLAALLINDHAWRSSNRSIMETVLSKNKDHNKKAEGSRVILADKQGFLAASESKSINDAFFESEQKKKLNLFELASSLLRFYDNYPTMRISDPARLDYIFYSTKPYIQNPEGTFHDSYTNTLFWKLLTSEFRLQESFRFADRMQPDDARSVGQLFDELPYPDYSDSEFWKKILVKLGNNYPVHRNAAAGIYNAGVLHMTSGDDFRGATITAGAVGSHARARNTTISSVDQSIEKGGLSAELEALLIAIRKEPDSPAKIVAEENVEKASVAASEGKQALMAAYLKAGGQWALGIAEKIGVALATAELKNSLGL